MRLVAVCKVLDEADIIEAFVRHTAHYAAQLFLDNGSIDGTVEILRKLRGEGLNLTILQNGSRLFNETAYNTQLLYRAISEHGADWVTFLDADEFIDDRTSPLLDSLDSVSPLISCARVMLTNYHPTSADDVSELVVPSRIQWVDQRTDVPKVIVRASVVTRNVFVQGGAP